MSIFDKVVDFFSGGAGTAIVQEIGKHFPPAMSDADKSAATLAMTQAQNVQQIELLKLAKESDDDFNQRIKDLEGTASDLKAVPFFGTIVLFLRGTQRPLWGFATLVVDYMWFSQAWQLDEKQSAAAYSINVLVLSFLFGERALTNVLPYFSQMFKARAGV